MRTLQTLGEGVVETGTVEVGVAVGIGVGVDIAGEGVDVEPDGCVGAGVDVGAGLTVIETALDVGDVTGVEALSVTLQVTECEVSAAV